MHDMSGPIIVRKKTANSNPLDGNLAAMGALAWVRRGEWPRHNNNAKRVRIADMFCGCGGLSLGALEAARRAGRQIEIRTAIDSDKDAFSVYEKNFSEIIATVGNGDITEIIDGILGKQLTTTENAVRERCGGIDLLLAGPPCQGNSDLNNSTRRNDPRNKLYLRAVRAIEVLDPKFAFIENVPGVVHDRGNVVGEAVAALSRKGYTVSTTLIDVQSIGLPQRRRRHVLFAAKEFDRKIHDLVPETTENLIVPLGPFIAGLEDEDPESGALIHRSAKLTEENKKRVRHLFENGLYDLPDSARPPCHRDKPHSYQSVYGRLRWTKPAQTITSGFGSPGQGRFIHPRRQRLITPHEAARIQGFPDFYDFSPARGLTALRTMIGNAVPPPVMILLAGSLFNNGFL
jgi:DNA (cytosine-5)-methyltransferase 1